MSILPRAWHRHSANVVDNVVLHTANWTAFVSGELQRCHRSVKREIEIRGCRTDIGLDGLPIDSYQPSESRAVVNTVLAAIGVNIPRLSNDTSSRNSAALEQDTFSCS